MCDEEGLVKKKKNGACEASRFGAAGKTTGLHVYVRVFFTVRPVLVFFFPVFLSAHFAALTTHAFYSM